MSSSPESEESSRELEEARSRLEVINIEGDDFEDKSEGTFDLEEPLNPLYELPDAHGTPSKKDKDATNASLKQQKTEEGSPVHFDFKSPLQPEPEASKGGESGPLTYTVLEEENMDPDSLVEGGEDEEGEKDSSTGSSTYSNEGFEEEEDHPSSESLSSPERSTCSSSREPGVLSSDQSSSAQDQKNGVSFFVDFEGEALSPGGSPPFPPRRRTNTLDERMTQSVIEDRRSLDSSLSFYVDFSSSDANERGSKPPPSRTLRRPPAKQPLRTTHHHHPSTASKKPPSKKVPPKQKKEPPREDSFETIKFFFKKLLKKVDELACGEDRSLTSVRRKKRMAERMLEFLDEEELKLSKGQTLTRESEIDACLSSDKKPALRRERTFDLDSAEPKKLMLVEIEKNDNSKAKRNQKLFSQQKVFFTRRMKREIPKIEKRIKELEKQLSKDRLPSSASSSKLITARKQCWPMSDRELQIVEGSSKPKRRLPAPTYPAPRLPAKKLSQPNRMTQSLIEESPSGGGVGPSTSFLEIASKKQRSKERIKINVTDRSGISPSYSWYLNQDFSSNDEPEDEIVWIRRESPRRLYYEERFYSPTVLQRRSRFSDPEEDFLRPPPRRANVNNFGQTFPSPSRKNSEALMSSGLAVRKTKVSRTPHPPTVSSSPIANRGIQTRELSVYSPPWEESLSEVRRTEYIDLNTDEYVMESRRKIVSPPMKKNHHLPFSSKIPKTRSPYESGKKSAAKPGPSSRGPKASVKSRSHHSRNSHMST